MNSEKHRKKAFAALLSVLSNSSLVISKLIIGLLIGSVAVISEAIHSGLDLLASFIALVAVRTAGKPADEAHPFGHGKFENISGVIEAVLIFVAAAWIIYEAVHKILSPAPLTLIGWGVVVMLTSAAVNYLVSRFLFKVAEETESVALKADGWHLRTDVYTSAGVMAGLAIIIVAQRLFGKELLWLDPVAAIMVAALILRAALRLTIYSAGDLLDTRLPTEEEQLICDHVISQIPLVRGFHALRTRKAGAKRFIEFHLLVEPNMSVEDSHGITETVSKQIEEHFPDAYITIHIEPCDGNCTPECVAGCWFIKKKSSDPGRTAEEGRAK
jgi:cation diffusion facilitator family transporter